MVLVAYLIGTVASAQVPFTKAATKEVMKRVADWQIANPNNGAEHDDLDWTNFFQNRIYINQYLPGSRRRIITCRIQKIIRFP